MMKILILTIAIVFPVAGLADEQVVKKHVVVNADEPHDEHIEEIIQRVEAMAGEDGRFQVFVKRLGDGEVEVEEIAMPHEDLAHLTPHAGHAIMMKGKRPHMPKISEAAAECVLKNIRHAATDAAARAVVQACSVLNPKPDE
jgi:hypothetical protein